MAMNGAISIENTRRGDGGFSLLEVLIANVMLAIGLLAIAAMQDVALSRNANSKQLSVATSLATEMMERIRYNSPANATAIPGGGFLYNGIQACSNLALADCPGGETAGNATALNNLTANGDFAQWAARLKATDAAGNLLLPNAVGQVNSVAIGPASMNQVQVIVNLQWRVGILPKTIAMNTIVSP
jgi:type IV pilus assembly protein PilV